MRSAVAALLLTCLWTSSAYAQCAPAPDSAYFFRDLSELRAEARIAGNRAFFERLLSTDFQAHDRNGKPLSKTGFIAAELTPAAVGRARRFYAISDYRLAEHRRGHTVVTYLLREGVAETAGGAPEELRLRETYEVVDGQWRLTAVDIEPVPVVAPLSPAG